ncbi:CPBP family intramembrane metalloprotease [Gracilibacillus salitolerans]|uniref:CPBP family intramembrane metalloprotease n=1 Tax=Gracilibacillus salitolerans TaxID=2663022 RepID=A0A5Q2TPC5_9BACI|nr:CPBP family intramembrane glutamic endopeptidase [Gracilibacillus salitolerans]QGH35962.1 CPBP family intramembrane metalloprotease [Gracilibacillus salitolerans]
MKKTKDNFIQIIIGTIFLCGMMVISYGNNTTLVLLVFACLFALGIAIKRYRYIIINIFIFLLSFQLYVSVRQLLHIYMENIQVIVILDRILLSIVILSLVFTSYLYKKPVDSYLNKPQWHNRVYFPFVTHGFHFIKISKFLKIAILCNVVVFVPLILFFNNMEQIRNLLFFAIIFSLINATIEELIWRGAFLNLLSKEFSMVFALIVTSLAFGIQHVVLGIPILAAVSFSIGGLFFAIVVIRANSIFPAIMWHFIINLFMVFSGLII